MKVKQIILFEDVVIEYVPFFMNPKSEEKAAGCDDLSVVVDLYAKNISKNISIKKKINKIFDKRPNNDLNLA